MIGITTTAALAKTMAALGCAAGAHLLWKATPSNRLRAQLRRSFDAAELFLKQKRGRQERRVYPFIHDVRIYPDRTQVTFRLPIGLDPKKVQNHLWAFRQVFGERAEVSGDDSLFVLKVAGEPLKTFNYDWTEIEPQSRKHALPVVVGRSQTGWVSFDMAEHPHLLIAGETGSGKSVCLRSILTTMIRSAAPNRLFCADLKRSEFHLFRDIAEEVAVEPNQLKHRLLWLDKEMQRRGDQLDAGGVANILDLPERPPFIVMAIDEVALLKKEKLCMELIERVAAIGRALGVFLILSMQRPDADVLDGKLKQCLTVRLSFRQSDELNSRIAIGVPGAELIRPKDKGQMLAKLDTLQRVQAPLLEVDDAKTLLADYKRPPVTKKPIVIEQPEVKQDDNDELFVQEGYL